MKYPIDKEGVQAIATIKALPTASVDQLVAALESAPFLSDIEQMAAQIVKQVPNTSHSQIASVLEWIYSLYYIRELSGVKRAQFFEDVIEGIQDIPELKSTPDEFSKLQSRIEKLVNIDTLQTISKASRLQRDGERLYCSAKILSDIRPVFGSEPTVRPLGAVLTHTLKIAYHEGGEKHREFHVILDSADLEALSNTVHRAQAKDATLRDLLKDAKLPNLAE